MKTKIYRIGGLILSALFMLTSCIDEDYKNIVQQGDPLIGVNALGDADLEF